jgi:alcohol dehydrogenase class IV
MPLEKVGERAMELGGKKVLIVTDKVLQPLELLKKLKKFKKFRHAITHF